MRLNSSKYIHFWHDCQMNIKSTIILSSLCLTPPLCVPQQPLRRHWSVRGHTIRSHGPFPLPDFGSSNRSTMCFLMMSSSSSVNTLLFPPSPSTQSFPPWSCHWVKSGGLQKHQRIDGQKHIFQHSKQPEHHGISGMFFLSSPPSVPSLTISASLCH